MLVAKDESTGATLVYDCLAKGPGDDWVVGQFVRDLEDYRDAVTSASRLTVNRRCSHYSRRSLRRGKATPC